MPRAEPAPPPATTLPPTDAVPWWRRLLPWAVVLGIGLFLVVKIDRKALVASLQTVPAGRYVPFVLAFSLVNLLCDALATWRAYRPVARSLRFGAVFTARGASYLPGILNYHAGQAYLTYLLSRRYRVPLPQVIGATLAVYASTLGNLILLTGLSLLGAGGQPAWVRPMIAVLLTGLAGYLAVLAWRPGFLARFSVFAPLFDIGAVGHLKLMAWRVPHVGCLFGSLWLAYRFFHVEIPLGASLATLPLILLVSALPLTPQGAGTRELMAIELLTPFVRAPGADPTAPLVAAGGAFVLVATLGQALLGLALFSKNRRMFRGAEGG